MLKVQIEKNFKNFSLDVNFSANNNILGLLGASGSGKSLSLKCIAGIEKPDSGKIILKDRVLFDSEKKINLRPQDRRVGYLFQDYALIPHMTVFENIQIGLRDDKTNEGSQLVMDKIREMRLEGLENNLPREISGGEKQRVALARILINEPELILLDEPFSALDEYLRWQIEMDVKDILEKLDIPVILVSHSRDEVYRICDEICVLNDGKSEDVMETKELFKNPKTYSSSLLSGCKNFSRIERIGEKRIYSKDWGIELDIEEELVDQRYIGVRSHFIDIVYEEGGNTFPLETDRIIDDLFTTIIMAKTQMENQLLRIEIDKENFKKLDLNRKAYFRIKKENIMLLK